MILLVLLSLICITMSEIHWVVTEDGRLEAQADSLFNMHQSHDLVQFLKQEERVRRVDIAQSRLSNQKLVIDDHEKQDDPQIEERLMKSDKDCLLAGRPLSQQDLFISSVVPLDVVGYKISDLLGPVKKAPKKARQPQCGSLPFSMAAFEHLNAMHLSTRQQLIYASELNILNSLEKDFPWQNTTDYGHAVAEALKKKTRKNAWILYNLASYYWRVEGNAVEAVECARHALHHSPREGHAVSMINLANIFHQSSHSEDAATVLEVAIVLNDTLATLHYAIGHVYAVQMQFSKSVAAFERALELDPSLPRATVHQAAVRCHQKVEKALEKQHENLQKTLTELQSYQVRLNNLQKVQEEMTFHLADPETKQQMEYAYDYYTYGPLPGLACHWTDDDGVRFLWCDNEDANSYRMTKNRKIAELSHHNSLKVHPITGELLPSDVIILESKEGRVSPNIETRTIDNKTVRVVEIPKLDFDLEKRYLDSLEFKKGKVDLCKPTGKHLFAHASHRLPVDENLWPTQLECSNVRLPTYEDVQQLHVFVPAEHKGFETRRLFNEYLNLNETTQHPLPWYPPHCHTYAPREDFFLSCCDHLLGIQKVKKRDRGKAVPERPLKPVLLQMAHTSTESDAEVGQRIATLLKYNIGPRWLVYNLAALYWRTVGLNSEALMCLRLALHENATIWKWDDIALVQLSYLAFAAGERLDDAVVVVREALNADSKEPVAHMLLGLYLIQQSNLTGAEFHLKEALRLNPSCSRSLNYLKAVRCAQKFPKQSVPDEPVVPRESKVTLTKPPTLPLERQLAGGPKYFCMREQGQEHCYLEERSVPGEAAVSAAECVRPPPLASFLLPSSSRDGSFSNPSIVSEATMKKLQPERRSFTGRSSSPVRVAPLAPTEIEVELDLTVDQQTFATTISKMWIQAEEHKRLLAKIKDTTRTPAQHARHPVVTPYPLEDSHRFDKPDVASSSPIAPPEPPKSVPYLPIDNELPEVLPEPAHWMLKLGAKLITLPTSSAECAFWKSRIKLDLPTSTWLSVTAKGFSLSNYVDFVSPIGDLVEEPVCPQDKVGSMATLDHLHGFQFRHKLGAYYRPEKGLKDAFESLGGEDSSETVESMATRLALAMRHTTSETMSRAENRAHRFDDSKVPWLLTTVAALYWRIRGNASMAIECLRHSLYYAPPNYRDLGLVSLANVYHQAGTLRSALIAAGAALQVSPKFVVVHFTLANIYAALGDYHRAALFYYSTLALQQNFDPAKERLKTIYCHIGNLPEVPLSAEPQPQIGLHVGF